MQGGDGVGEAEGWQGRWSVGLAGDVGETAHGLGEGAEAGSMGVGAGLSESGGANHHEPVIDRRHLVPAQPPV